MINKNEKICIESIKNLICSKKFRKINNSTKIFQLIKFLDIYILFILLYIFSSFNPFNGRIFLCTIYNNEEDIAYIHIWRLYNYVDRFIIVISNLTHSLQPKNTSLKLFENELKPYMNKIDIVNFDNICNKKLYPGINLNWCLEKSQRDYAVSYIESNYNPTENDLLISVDIDEILTREGIKYIKKHPPKNFKFIQGSLYFPYFYHRIEEWNRGLVLRYNKNMKSLSYFRLVNIKDSNLIRYDYNISKSLITHCSYCFKNIEEYKKKLKSYDHTELNKEPYITNNWIFKSHYCREKINHEGGYDEPYEGWKDLIPNDERLKYLIDRSYRYNISQTNYTEKDLENLCDRKFNRTPFD